MTHSLTRLAFRISLGIFLVASVTLRGQVISASLSQTFLNPTPAAHVEFFGSSVATLENDRILIAARQDDTGGSSAGAVYLFHTNGTLLTLFTNPVPSLASFGSSLAVIADNVLVGLPAGAGSVYLLTTNAAAITVFTNPAPSKPQVFGVAVAALNNEMVAIGARGNGNGFVPSSPRFGAVFLHFYERRSHHHHHEPNSQYYSSLSVF